jgi:hypothetical protein
MSRRLTLAIVEAMLRILAAFPAGAGKAMPRWVARQRQLPVQTEAFGPICVVFEEPRQQRVQRRKPPDRPAVEGGWAG